MRVDLSRSEINRLCAVLRKHHARSVRDNDRGDAEAAAMRDHELYDKLIAAKVAGEE